MNPYAEPPTLLHIDRNSGQTLSAQPLLEFYGDAGAPMPVGSRNYAVAFWGGDFYVFYENTWVDTSTKVWKIDPAGAVVEIFHDTGLHVVGAGVSTCAPVIGPS